MEFTYAEIDLLPAVSAWASAACENKSWDVAPESNASGKYTLFAESVRVVEDSTAFLSSGKGTRKKSKEHLALLLTLGFEFQWYGRVLIGSSTVGTTKGTVHFRGIDNDNWNDANAWQVTSKLKAEEVPLALIPNQDRESTLSEIDVEFRSIVASREVRGYFSAIIRTVLDALCRCTSVDTANAAKAKPIDFWRSTTGDGLDDCVGGEGEGGDLDPCFVSDLRRQLLGKRFLDAVEGRSELHDRLDVSFCSLRDENIGELCECIAGHAATLTTLDLHRNEISDDGVATLFGRLQESDFAIEKLNLLSTALATGACRLYAQRSRWGRFLRCRA